MIKTHSWALQSYAKKKHVVNCYEWQVLMPFSCQFMAKSKFLRDKAEPMGSLIGSKAPGHPRHILFDPQLPVTHELLSLIRTTTQALHVSKDHTSESDRKPHCSMGFYEQCVGCSVGQSGSSSLTVLTVMVPRIATKTHSEFTRKPKLLVWHLQQLWSLYLVSPPNIKH